MRPAPVGPAPPVVLGSDDQTDAALDVGRWERLAAAVLAAQGAPPGSELSLAFVDEATMADLRRDHLGEEGPTDVLSFPLDDEPLADPTVPRLLGDVVICPAVAVRNAPDHAGTIDDEIALLVVHGILHVLGHDHAVTSERVVMWARERDLLDRFHGGLARDPWSTSPVDADG